MDNTNQSKAGTYLLLLILFFISISIINKIADITQKPESPNNQNSIEQSKKNVENILLEMKKFTDGVRDVEKEVSDVLQIKKTRARLVPVYLAFINLKQVYNNACLRAESLKRQDLENDKLNKDFFDGMDILSLGFCSKGSSYEQFAEYINSGSIASLSKAEKDLIDGDKMVITGLAKVILVAKELGVDVEKIDK
ncbi:MAG: hypothetical protein M0Q92_00680 [Methanoregula sp.]|jgi:hypothetical protein|nr:hypothetical protein [Methanoregula sp.]